MARITVEDNDIHAIINTGPLTSVHLYSFKHSVSGIGYARLNTETDEYDEEFGVDLALSRATERMNKKIQKKLIRSLNG